MTPNARILGFLAALMLMASTGAVGAQTLSVSGNPGLLRVNAAVAGSEPIAVSNSATTYTVVTGVPNRTYAISAQLNANMPAGVTLTASATAPPGGTSLGPVALDVTARNIVTGIPKNTTSTQTITYALAALASAGVIPNSSRTVTLTVYRFP